MYLWLSERAQTDADYEQARASWSQLLRECRAADCAADEARDAAEEAREAVASEEAARARRAEWEREGREREAKWEAERAEWQREREADLAASAEGEVRLAELTARLAALDRARALEPVRWEMPEETRERLYGGAEMVWGSVEGKRAVATPKVFKLTGMSAEEVRGVASEVSRECTGTEERVAMNRSGLS